MNFKLIAVSFFLLIFTFAQAQFTSQYKGKASFAKFQKTITKVVLTENEEFNKAFREAVKLNWKESKYEFITEKQLANLRPNEKYTFIYIHDFNVKDQKKTVKALALSKFASRDHQTFLSNTFAYISIDSKSMEQELTDLNYRISNMVKQLNDIVKNVWEKDIKAPSAEAMRNELSKAYAKNAWKLKNKTLLVDVNYLALKIVDKEEIIAIYNYPIEFVPKSEIENAIASKDTSKAYLVSAQNLYKINSVTDCATGQILFANFVEESPTTFEVNYLFDNKDAGLLNLAVKKSKEPKEKLSKEDKIKAKEEKKKYKSSVEVEDMD